MEKKEITSIKVGQLKEGDIEEEIEDFTDALEAPIIEETTEPVPFYSNILSCSINMKGHPVDFL